MSEVSSSMHRRTMIEQRVAQHYSQRDLEEKILDALVAAGKDLDSLTVEDLAPVDESHIGGRDATIAFAEQINFMPGSHILDVGCGIGGASRYFAETCDCRVTGIDLTEDFVRTAEALARRLDLQDRVSYRRASALDLPFDGQSFDGAYMMHVGMNIEDKSALFAEVRRVLKPGAAFGVYDVMLTGKGEPSFPLPCALTPETAFIVAIADYRKALDAAGFQSEKERDRLDVARAFFRQEMQSLAKAGGPPPLGVHILLKDEAPRIFANVVNLFEAGVLTPVELVCRAH
jgi:2-polyprenyl-3-methyl-5-hydroxy-6-metoxy-1,4-benzoquinol methylase